MANAFKSGASRSRSTNDFNERAKLLSERLGAIEKPAQVKRSNAPRRAFKAAPNAAAAGDEAAPQTEDHADGTEA